MQKMQSITNYIEIVIYLEIYRCQHVRLSGKRKFILCYCILLSKNNSYLPKQLVSFQKYL